MIEIKKEAYPAMIGRIDKLPINTMFARSVLARHADGRVYANREAEPDAFYIIHGYGMTLLFGNNEDKTFRDDLANYFSAVQKDEWLQACPDAWCDFLRPIAGEGAEFSRLNFTFDEASFNARNGEENAEGFTVRRTPVELIPQLEGAVVPKEFWWPERLSDCVSYTVFTDGKPASTAFSAYLHGSRLEIGIETAPEYRGRGFAGICCAALIRYCLSNGLVPEWSCRYENTGSVRLARSLGFTETKRFPYFRMRALENP